MANYITSREKEYDSEYFYTHIYFWELGDWLPETRGSSLDPRLSITGENNLFGRKCVRNRESS